MRRVSPAALASLLLAGALLARPPLELQQRQDQRTRDEAVLDSQERAKHPQASETGEGSYGRTPAELVPYRRTASPYRRLYLTAPLFRGPGRDKPAPSGLERVRVGLIAPLEGPTADDAGSSLSRGIELALDEANADGGYRGIPFELVVRNDQPLWGSSANSLVELAYVEKIWALIDSVDSASTHVTLRATMKAEVPVINVGSSDPTVTETGIPWIIRVTPDDRQTGYRLASLLFEEKAYSRVAVLRSNDRYGRLGIQEFRDAARRLARPIPLEIPFDPLQEEFGSQLDRLEEAGADAAVLWCLAEPAGRILRQMRERGMTHAVVGTDRLVSPTFLDLAGKAAENVQVTYWMDPSRQGDELWNDFRRRYADRFGAAPDAFASYGYDAAMIVVGAVRSEGLNRARIRDFLANVRSYRGVSGAMQFDTMSNNIAPLHIGRVEGGRFVFR